MNPTISELEEHWDRIEFLSRKKQLKVIRQMRKRADETIRQIAHPRGEELPIPTVDLPLSEQFDSYGYNPHPRRSFMTAAFNELDNQ